MLVEALSFGNNELLLDTEICANEIENVLYMVVRLSRSQDLAKDDLCSGM